MCEEFGNPDEDMIGGYHCKRQICAAKEYCDGQEELLGGGQVACMGKCTPIPYTDALASIVHEGVPRCISSADRGNADKNNGCVYSQDRRSRACMVDNMFIIYGMLPSGSEVPLSNFLLQDDLGPATRAPYLACMQPDG